MKFFAQAADGSAVAPELWSLLIFVLLLILYKFKKRWRKLIPRVRSNHTLSRAPRYVQMYAYPQTLQVKEPKGDINSYPRNISNVQFFDVYDEDGIHWTEGPVSGDSSLLERPIYGTTEHQTVFTPAPTFYNMVVALTSRAFRDPGTEPNIEGCEIIKTVVQMIISILQDLDIPDFSIPEWIEEREEKGKKCDRAVYEKYLTYLDGNPEAVEEAFEQYTFYNSSPKECSLRMKLKEKFLDENIKPRLYAIFDPIHAILSGPVNLSLGNLFQENLPGY